MKPPYNIAHFLGKKISSRIDSKIERDLHISQRATMKLMMAFAMIIVTILTVSHAKGKSRL